MPLFVKGETELLDHKVSLSTKAYTASECNWCEWLCSDLIPQDQQTAKAISVCSEVLKADPQNVNALKDRAEAYLQDDQYEEGRSQYMDTIIIFYLNHCNSFYILLITGWCCLYIGCTIIVFKYSWQILLLSPEDCSQNDYAKWPNSVFFAAIKDFESAKEHSENDRQIKEGLERAQRLLKQSQKRDYYKILGVKRLDNTYNNSLSTVNQCRGLILILK